jgi:hypothetical protein
VSKRLYFFSQKYAQNTVMLHYIVANKIKFLLWYITAVIKFYHYCKHKFTFKFTAGTVNMAEM